MPRYAERFQNSDAVKHYREAVYHPDSQDSFLWSMEQERLHQIFSAFREKHGSIRYLDFATGTGRVLGEMEGYAESSLGVDISADMLAEARKSVTRSELLVANVLENPLEVRGPFDVVTAFRFFLNVEPDVQSAIMKFLSANLADAESVLVFNNHGNAKSIRHLSILWRRRKGEVHHELSLSRVQELLEASGLEIVESFGFGICPSFFYRGLLRPLAKRIDAWASRISAFRSWSVDILYVCRRRVKASAP